MSKEYKFNGKTYVIAKRGVNEASCFGCAFDEATGKTCREFQQITNAPNCTGKNIVFVEKPTSTTQNDSELQYCKETAWGVKPENNVEIRTASIKPDTTTQAWSFRLEMANGYRPASINVVASKTAENCKFTAAIVPCENRFIVCLIENGKLAPSDYPKQHKTRESAEKEAERLCKLHHQEFVVLQVVSAIKPQRPKKEVFA